MDYMDPRKVWIRNNREKHNANCRRSYQKHKEQRTLKVMEWHRNHPEAVSRINRRQYLSALQYIHAYLREHLCEHCGQPYEGKTRLVFHHIDKSTKVKEVTQMAIHRKSSLEDIQAEIGKCIVLCNSCHSKHHAAERRAMKNAQ